MTALPAEFGFSATVLRSAISSPGTPAARCRAEVNDAFTLPGYEVLGVIGLGGTATVYKAQQLWPRRLVAIKVIERFLAGYGEIVARFGQEQALGVRLRHPNLIAVLDAGRAAGCPYLVMEYIDGDNLGDLIARYGRLPVAEACEVIRQAALGLQYIHELGLVHRDVKPFNLMLTSAGEVKVLDLGLARYLDEPDPGERITWYGQFLGTLDYVAPEQCADPHTVDIRADVYGLGCTLYELLAGQAPFARPEYQSAFKKMKAHVEAPVPSIRKTRPDVSVRLASVLRRMLAKDRAERYACLADLVRAVQPFATGADLARLAQAGHAASVRNVELLATDLCLHGPACPTTASARLR